MYFTRLETAIIQELSKNTELFKEFYIESLLATDEACFIRLELTDSVISILAKEKYLVLTTDLDLYLYLLGIGIDAINFNNLLPFL